MLTRDAILASDDIKSQIEDVPEWGGSVRVRGMTGKDRDAYEYALWEHKEATGAKLDLRNARARLVALTVCDEHGKRIFSDADIEALGEKSASVLDRLYDVARELSGMTQGTQERLVKNSESDQSEDSGSD